MGEKTARIDHDRAGGNPFASSFQTGRLPTGLFSTTSIEEGFYRGGNDRVQLIAMQAMESTKPLALLPASVNQSSKCCNLHQFERQGRTD